MSWATFYDFLAKFSYFMSTGFTSDPYEDLTQEPEESCPTTPEYEVYSSLDDDYHCFPNGPLGQYDKDRILEQLFVSMGVFNNKEARNLVLKQYQGVDADFYHALSLLLTYDYMTIMQNEILSVQLYRNPWCWLRFCNDSLFRRDYYVLFQLLNENAFNVENLPAEWAENVHFAHQVLKYIYQ